MQYVIQIPFIVAMLPKILYRTFMKKIIVLFFKDTSQLVIICSSENEYKSPMISAMDKFRSPKIAVAGVKKIQEYLKKKYTSKNEFDSSVDVIDSMA